MVELDSTVPGIWTYVFRRTCLICGIEMISTVAFLDEQGPALSGCSLWIYMNRNNSLADMARGDSDTSVIAALVDRAWETIRRYQLRAWFPRAPSKLNPSDPPLGIGGFLFALRFRRSCLPLPPSIENVWHRRNGRAPPPTRPVRRASLAVLLRDVEPNSCSPCDPRDAPAGKHRPLFHQEMKMGGVTR